MSELEFGRCRSCDTSLADEDEAEQRLCDDCWILEHLPPDPPADSTTP